MSNIEEGSPLIVAEDSVPQTSNKRSLAALFAVVILAVIGAVGYVSMHTVSSLPVTTNLKVHHHASKVMKAVKSLNLDEFNVGYDATVNNKAEKAKVIGDSIMGPFSYLSGTTMEYTPEGSEWTFIVNYGTDVKKVTKHDDGSIKKSVTLGTFKGLDGEANLIFADGDQCITKDGPYFGRVGIRCGETSEIAEILSRSSCRFVIRANTAMQCAHDEKIYGSEAARAAARDRVNQVYIDAASE
jgi:ribosome-associated toxin RatA of RatAB toxin-antitoxin module